MPGKTDLSELNCSLARTLDIVGDWWTLLIVRDAFIGVRRFGDFQESLGIAKNILAARLQQLCEAGIMTRSGPERRPLYQLTEKGRGLLPAMVALMQWGDRFASADKPPVIVTDARGRTIAPVKLRNDRGDIAGSDVRFTAGPGANARTRAFLGALRAAQAKTIEPTARTPP